MSTIHGNDVLVQNVERFLHIKEENINIYQKNVEKMVDNNAVLCNNHYKKQRYT